MIKQKLLILIFTLGLFLPLSYVSAGIIVSPHKYAWSNNAGYINFENVVVNDSALSGHSWSANKGWINFSPAQGGVLNNGAGNLSGSAWGEKLGWVDFDNVSINPSTGQFSGTATGALIGTITFDCPNYCDVQTDWRQAVAPPVASSGTGGSVSGGNAISAPLPPTVIPNETPPGVISSPEATTDAITENPALFDIISEAVKVKVAPGELLPVSVKLANFGGGKRVDVLITYLIITSTGEEIYHSDETVAVETTANFVKTIQIPFGTKPGIYTARTSITYKGQLVPATTQFSFTVQRKILGLFQSDFLLYGGITILLGIIVALLGYALIKRHRRGRFSPFDYSNVAHGERTFYEILSDTIMEMRQRVGDDALIIASHIDGLKIDKGTGRVLGLTEHPSKIIATLVSEYEKLLGKKVSFSFRREKTGSAGSL